MEECTCLQQIKIPLLRNSLRSSGAAVRLDAKLCDVHVAKMYLTALLYVDIVMESVQICQHYSCKNSVMMY